MSNINWKAFDLVDLKTVSLETCVGITTLKNWPESRPDRLRYLEYGIELGWLEKHLKDELIENEELSLKDLLNYFGAEKDVLTPTVISEITGESTRTLRNWWNSTKTKKALCLNLILGAICMLIVSKHKELQKHWETTELEKKHAFLAHDALDQHIKRVAFQKWQEAK